MYSSAERAHLLKKDLKQSSTLRVLLLCLGLIVVTMGSVTLSMGAMLGPPLLVGPGLCLTLGGMLCLGTSIYFGLKQHHINKQQKSASSAQSVSSRKILTLSLTRSCERSKYPTTVSNRHTVQSH
ncbi:uncharacterized protein LOC111268912 isoform X3 [Varroa jacobsoni]|uniref:uncharacterized protein LOC111268912 isoform X3 n=1 Tax=Varroa jacobsoni TaxID=62625 RepID=UPI000BF63B21|nr:uncharacterized protein LOC111268912 isoform X3 [Varroa jacobsoni]